MKFIVDELPNGCSECPISKKEYHGKFGTFYSCPLTGESTIGGCSWMQGQLKICKSCPLAILK